ncbi:MAG: PaaI family thioesterase, partial [Burkholderiales bacterium]
MSDVAAIQSFLEPLLPGLMGLKLTEVGPERVVATMTVRPDLCTTGGTLHGGAMMAFADTLGAVGTFVNLPAGAR